MSIEDQRLFQHIAGTLLDELGYETVSLGDMSLKEKARLLSLKVKYEALQSGRHVLQRMGVFPPIYGVAPKKSQA
jgi:hypothetical protein